MKEKILMLLIGLSLFIGVLSSANVLAAVSVGVNEGDWIEYDYVYTGSPPSYFLPSWLRVDFKSIQGTNITAEITGQSPNGNVTESLNFDLETGAPGFIIIPANLDVGDEFYNDYHEELGKKIFAIAGTEESTYAGAKRTVVYAIVSFTDSSHIELHWDKATGILLQVEQLLLQIDQSSDDFYGKTLANKTNMWQSAPALPVITSPLVITPVKDIYNVGDWLEAEFTVKNIGDAPITFDVLTVGGRLNGEIPAEGPPDFTHRSVTIQPEQSHSYEGTLELTEAGNYHFFVAYYIENPTEEEKKLLDENNWNTYIDLTEGLTDQSRTKEITVVPTTPPEKAERIWGIPVDFRFERDFSVKGKGGYYNLPDVRYLQIVLNTDPDTQVATHGDGSPGDETTYFGSLTENAVERFQEKYDLTERNGFVGYVTREKLNEILTEKFTEAYNEKFGVLNKEERKSTIWEYIKEFKSEYLPEDFPNELILAVATQETGEYAHWNNEHVADDWGRGIMQITTDSYVGAGGVDSNSEDCIKAKNRDRKIYSSRYYSNTLKGMEANIKDGIYALGDKYHQVKEDNIQPPEGYTKEEIIWMSTVQRYNGFRAKSSEYIWYVGDKLIRLANGEYGNFGGFDNEYARLLGEKIQKVYNEKITLHSPVQLRVYDSERNVTGLVNGEVRECIPNSIYDNETRTVLIFFPSHDYHYDVMGVEEGTYGLDAVFFDEGESVSFVATDISIVSEALHQYTIDWDALSMGEEGVSVMVDSVGDGIFEYTFASDSELTQDELIQQVPTAEAFPMWLIGLAVAAIAITIASAAIAVFWGRRKRAPVKV